MARDERGAVTAEAAVVIPVLVIIALVLAWFVTLGTAQARAVDAAREAARALARGDSTSSSRALAARVAPDGARVRLDRSGGTVVVQVTVPVDPPLDLLDFLPDRHVTGEAVSLVEGS